MSDQFSNFFNACAKTINKAYGRLPPGKPVPASLRAEVMKWFGTREEYWSLHEQWTAEAQAKWFAGSDEDGSIMEKTEGFPYQGKWH